MLESIVAVNTCQDFQVCLSCWKQPEIVRKYGQPVAGKEITTVRFEDGYDNEVCDICGGYLR